MNNKIPLSRFEDIVVQELKDEILVCDTKSNQVFCLNQTAGEVWKLCDGKTDVTQISLILSKKLKTNISEELVLFSLSELSENNLLSEKLVTDNFTFGLSRREVIRKIGLGSLIAFPVISTVVMPRAAHAQSCLGTIGCACDAGSCNDPNSCCELTDTCVALPPVCAVDADCPCGLVCCAPSNPVCNPGC